MHPIRYIPKTIKEYAIYKGYGEANGKINLLYINISWLNGKVKKKRNFPP